MNNDNNVKNIDLFLENFFSEKLSSNFSDIDLRQKLIVIIQQMASNDFPALVQLLYRLDVPERSLKLKLSKAPLEQSTDIIVGAILDRLCATFKAREAFRGKEDNISEEERW